MKIQYYCYTRNTHIDYGDFVLPDISNNQVEFIRKRILSITGDSDPKFTVPKWILIKFDNVIVWGCCCWNSLLTRDAFKDSLGRPVYGFFSLVITDFSINEIMLPLGMEYFKELYSKEIEPYWDSSERRNSTTSVSIPSKYKCIQASRNDYCNLLNTDIFKCQSLGELDKEEVIAAALTLDNVSLLIDNDNIEQATNKNGSFMNCLTPSVGFGLHYVKQQCPKCKKYVSSFTQTGVCFDCKEAEEIMRRRIKKDEDDMDKQMKLELELAQNKIAELKSELEMNRSQLKKKERWIKVLAVVSVALLIALLYSQDLFSLKLFEGKQETQYSLDRDSLNRGRGRYDNDFMQDQEASFKFLESAINVEAGAYEKFLVKVKSNVNNYEIKSDVDWIKILSTSENLITINIAANEQKHNRVGKVTVTYGNSSTNSIVITQNEKSN